MSKIMRRKRICLAGAVLMASSLVFTGCGAAKETAAVVEENTDLLVEVLQPTTTSIYLYSDFMGTIESAQEVVVMPKLAGTVTNKYFEVGDTVNAGDLLFTLDDEAIQISLTQAQASLESASASAQSAQVGFDAQVAAANATVGTMGSTEMQLINQVDRARKALEEAEANAKMAEENYNYKYKKIKFSQEDYDDAKDAKEDAEDDIEKYGDLLDKYKKLEDYADKGDWDAFNPKTGQSFDGSESADEITKAIEDEVGYTASQLDTKRDAAIAERNQAEDMIDDLKYARDGVELDAESTRVNKEVAAHAVDTAKQALELAEQNLAEYQGYTKASVTAGAQSTLAGANSSLTSAHAGLTNAQAAVDSAKLQLEYTKIHAPVTGVITEINVSEHNMVNAGSRSYVITSEDGIKAVFYVSEKVMLSLEEGQEAILERNDMEYNASISDISDVVDTTNGLFKIEAVIDGETASLITGSSVKLKTAIQSAESVMALPIDCVYYENQVPYVFCMADGKAVKTNIETGIADDEYIQVIGGLTADSQIISSWASGLSDGVGVYTEENSSPEAPAASESVETEADGTTEETTQETETGEDAAAEEIESEETETSDNTGTETAGE